MKRSYAPRQNRDAFGRDSTGSAPRTKPEVMPNGLKTTIVEELLGNPDSKAFQLGGGGL